MTQEEAKANIQDMPVGSKLQLIKTNGDIIEVVLASQNTAGIDEIGDGNMVMPAMPPAIIVQGKRWGVYRIDTDEIVRIARIG